MMPMRLSGFIFVLMFTLLEARDSIFKQPHHPGLLERKMTSPQSDKKIEAKRGIHQTIVGNKGMMSTAVADEEGNNMRPNELAKKSMSGTKMSKISGRNINASRNLNSEAKRQDKNNKGEAEETKQKGITSNESFPKLKSDEDSVEAANEVWTLMSRDYLGNGGGHHNPPTNNR